MLKDLTSLDMIENIKNWQDQYNAIEAVRQEELENKEEEKQTADDLLVISILEDDKKKAFTKNSNNEGLEKL